MVSPPDKGGAPVEALTREGGVILASEDGNALTYVVDGALGEEAQGNRSPEWQQILATRTPRAGARRTSPRRAAKRRARQPAARPSTSSSRPTSRARWSNPRSGRAEPPLAPGVTQATMYLRDNATGTYLPLVTEANTAPGTQFGGAYPFVSATPDLSHVVIASEVALTGRGLRSGLYEWSGGGLQLRERAARTGSPPRRPNWASSARFSRTRSPATARGSSGRTKKTSALAEVTCTCATPPAGETIQLDAAKGRRRTRKRLGAVPAGEQRRLAGVLHRQAAPDARTPPRNRARAPASPTCTSARSPKSPASSPAT